MASIDDRIVNMQFNNSSFEAGVAHTINTMDKLKAHLSSLSNSKGLDDLGKSAKNFNMDNMGVSIEGISAKLLTLGTIGVTALTRITNAAITTGKNLLNSFTLGPVSEGFSDYNAKITSVQTVVNATGRSLKDVNGFFNQLDHYADTTVFKLSDMTGALSKFVNAGVSLETAIPSIQGIGNMTALAGQGAEQAGVAYYNLAQSLAGGFLSTPDYRSLSLQNVATVEWKNHMIDAAVVAGTLKKTGKDMYSVLSDGSNKAFSSAALFNSELARQWASNKVLTKVLSDYGNEETEIGLKAFAAAKDVKSLPMMIDTLKAAVGTGWTDTFELVIGDLVEAKELFTGLTNSIGGFLERISKSRNDTLKFWKAFNGRAILIQGLKFAFQDLGDILHPIGLAFRDIFPKERVDIAGYSLKILTVRFRNLMILLRPAEDTMTNIRRTFAGIFALFSIGKQIVSGIASVFIRLFKEVLKGRGSVLKFTAGIGDFLVSIDKALKKGDSLKEIFQKIGDVLIVPIKLLGIAAKAIGSLFTRFKPPDFSGVSGGLSSTASFFDRAREAAAKFFGQFTLDGGKVGDIIAGMVENMKNFGQKIADVMGADSFAQVLDTIQTGLLAGIVALIAQFIKKFSLHSLGTSIFGNISESFDALTGSLQAMQTNLQSKTLLNIAIAVGVLAGSMLLLSTIKPEKLQSALTAMAAGFAELVLAMIVLVKYLGPAGSIKLPLITTSLIALATSLLIFAGAVKLFSMMKTEDLQKGLAGVGIILAEVAAFAVVLGFASGGILAGALAMIPMAIALTMLSGVVKLFSMMDWETLSRGLAGVVGVLTAVSLAALVIPPSLAISAIGVIEMAIALNGLYFAVKNFSSLNWTEMGKGLAGVAGVLAAIAAAMWLMPPNILIQAIALVVISSALLVLQKAVKKMGAMDGKTIGKGLGTIAGALAILAAGMYLMSGAIPGALALVVVTVALAGLVPIIKVLAGMSWGELIKGLISLAATFAILGISALLLAPVSPALLAIGAAIALIGVGIGAAAAGIGILAAGLGALAGIGSAGVAILLEVITNIIKKIPDFAVAMAKGFVEFVKTIGDAAPDIFKAVTELLKGLLQTIIDCAPKIGEAVAVLIDVMCDVLIKSAPKLIEAFLTLIEALLDGLTAHAPEIVDKLFKFAIALGEAIVKGIIEGIVTLLDDVWDAIWKLVGGIIDHVKKWLGISSPSTVFADLGKDIVKGMIKGIVSMFTNIFKIGISMVVSLISGVVSWIGHIVPEGVKAVFNFVVGIGAVIGNLIDSGISMVKNIIIGIGRTAKDLWDAGVGIVGGLFSGLWSALKGIPGQIWDVAKEIGAAIASAIAQGIKDLAFAPINAAKGLAADIFKGFGGFIGLGGPSKLFCEVGMQIQQGLANGISENTGYVDGAISDMTKSMTNSLSKSISSLPNLVDQMLDSDPVIRPILDLTAVSQEASRLNGMLGMNAVASLGQAKTISTIQAQNINGSNANNSVNPVTPQEIKFEQYNYSPKALSQVDIFRQTRNQLSLAKEALKL